MKGWLLILWLALAPAVQAQRLPDNFNPARAEREGRALVQELLSRRPAANYTNTGTLRIRPRSGPVREVPVRFTLLVDGDRWLNIYEVENGTAEQLNAFTLLSGVDQPNRYFRGHPRDPESLKPLTPDEAATNAFAGSDFALNDLGLEFLRWPTQRLLKKELRRSTSCNVLESVTTNAPAGAYGRVVSWLDMDTGGIVFAEAFEGNSRRRVKEFAPKSFKKVDGQWQLKEMEIANLSARSRTTIIFDLVIE